jgi:DGQHR domain-containing protein
MTRSTKARTYTYDALKFRQRTDRKAPVFVLFHAPAGEIDTWADVERLTPENKKGAQRPLKLLKAKNVSKFFRESPRNTIPTAIVVALDEASARFSADAAPARANGRRGKLRIRFSTKKPGLIIDGQHRVFGAIDYAYDVNLCVIAFLGGDDAERAFQFLVINNTAARVGKDHIKALNLQFDQARVNDRLLKSVGRTLGMKDPHYEDLQAIDSSGPFKGILALPTNPNGFVAPTAIESALAEIRNHRARLGIEDLEREVFLAIWSTIKKMMPDLWRESEERKLSHLLEKVSIYGLTAHIIRSFSYANQIADDPIDFSDEKVIRKYVEKIVSKIEATFWTIEWTAKALDTSFGRDTFIKSLEQIASNTQLREPWYKDVDVLGSSAVEAIEEARERKPLRAKPRRRSGR